MDSLGVKLKGIFLCEPIPFCSKRDLNWKAFGVCGGVILFALIVWILLLPESSSVEYAAKAEPERSVVEERAAQTTHDYLPPSGQARTGQKPHTGREDKSTESTRSMIVVREGGDLRTQIPPGSRLRIKLPEGIIVGSKSLPIIGEVASDYIHQDHLAIPRDAKVFGEIAFDSDSGRGEITWKTIELQDGRQRNFSAVALSLDGRAGLSGRVHSEAAKNTVGQVLTRFVGAYAEGSMQKGSVFGGSPGGSKNGFKNAIGETAKDRANTFADALKKEREWIEIEAGSESFAVLTQGFVFRDPGGSN